MITLVKIIVSEMDLGILFVTDQSDPLNGMKWNEIWSQSVLENRLTNQFRFLY